MPDQMKPGYGRPSGSKGTAVGEGAIPSFGRRRPGIAGKGHGVCYFNRGSGSESPSSHRSTDAATDSTASSSRRAPRWPAKHRPAIAPSATAPAGPRPATASSSHSGVSHISQRRPIREAAVVVALVQIEADDHHRSAPAASAGPQPGSARPRRPRRLVLSCACRISLCQTARQRGPPCTMGPRQPQAARSASARTSRDGRPGDGRRRSARLSLLASPVDAATAARRGRAASGSLRTRTTGRRIRCRRAELAERQVVGQKQGRHRHSAAGRKTSRAPAPASPSSSNEQAPRRSARAGSSLQTRTAAKKPRRRIPPGRAPSPPGRTRCAAPGPARTARQQAPTVWLLKRDQERRHQRAEAPAATTNSRPQSVVPKRSDQPGQQQQVDEQTAAR